MEKCLAPVYCTYILENSRKINEEERERDKYGMKNCGRAEEGVSEKIDGER